MEDGGSQWHSAFFEALKLELSEYKEHLNFINEFQLSKEALRMDVLVIKKDENIKIDKNLGIIFRQHNIFEFKSENDSLSINDFYKVYGYAMYYKSFEDVDIDNLTISFATTRHPRELLKHLENKRKFKITETYNGIYDVKGDILPIQIIESKKLSEEDNLWLKNLRSTLTTEELSKVIVKFKQQGIGDLINNAYIFKLMESNMKKIKGADKMTKSEVLKEIIDMAEEVGILEERRAQDRIEIAKKMFPEGLSAEQIAKITELPFETVKNLQLQFAK